MQCTKVVVSSSLNLLALLVEVRGSEAVFNHRSGLLSLIHPAGQSAQFLKRMARSNHDVEAGGDGLPQFPEVESTCGCGVGSEQLP